MDVLEFGQLMLDEFPFEPTDQQIQLTAALARFCSAQTPQDTVFILNGYAGTGKTSVMGALVRSLNKVGLRTVLLASTGRAAKVLANHTGFPAYTIHRKIYAGHAIAADGAYMAKVRPNPHVNTIFIVDEASMIGQGNDGGMNLLQDLVMYVYSGVNCKLILLGDTAQLPPVGSVESPAMSAPAFKALGLKVMRATITRTVRQRRQSGILYNATWLRRAMQNPDELPEPQITVGDFDDVAVVIPEDLEDELGMSFAEFGEEQTIMITRSNRRAVDFNLAIRQQIFDREEILAKGDRLIISKNNYFWTTLARRLRADQLREAADNSVEISGLPIPEVGEKEARENPIPDFLANGEVGVVEEILATETRDAIMFADVQLRLVDSGALIETKIILDALTSEVAGLDRAKYETIGRRALADAGVTTASPTAQREALHNDPYFNALQVKYAYAVTCHKAQGGQWDSVFVDMGYIAPEAYRTIDFYRWLYTSVTRATRRLTLLSPSCPIK